MDFLGYRITNRKIRPFAAMTRALRQSLKTRKRFKVSSVLLSEPILKFFDPEAEPEVHIHPVYYMSCKTSHVNKKYYSYHL